MKIHEYYFDAQSCLDQTLAPMIGKYLYGEFLERYGKITPSLVVQDAKRRTSPLHATGVFTWSKDQALKKCLLEEARHLLRSLKVRYLDLGPDKEEGTVRAFVNLRDDDAESERVYVPIVRAMSTKELREQMVATALQEARSWQHRYEHLREMTAIFSAIDKTAKKLGQS